MSEPTTAKKKGRQRSGGADWHMSREAVNLSVPTVIHWSDAECLEFMVTVRFGSWETVSCPHCGTVDRHYWRAREKRWKCKGCDSTFSVTSGTVFSKHKKPLRDILTSALMWINSAGGQPALELKRHMDTTYITPFILQHKLREGLVRGYNVGLINGDIEMDGAHQSGWRAAERRGKPQGSPAVDETTDVETLNAAMLTQTAHQARRKKKKPLDGALDPEYGRKLPKDRRIMFAVRKRSEGRGKGACMTRIAIGLAETSPVAESILKNFVAMPESYLNTDNAPAYTALGKGFKAHRTVDHAKELFGPNGENNNLAEELNGRFDRAEKGIYLNIEPKYMLDYAVEVAFRSDTCRVPNGVQLQIAMNSALNVGTSLFWTGFTHGRHRHVELIHPQPQPAPASGPAKGRRQTSSANGRPPR